MAPLGRFDLTDVIGLALPRCECKAQTDLHHMNEASSDDICRCKAPYCHTELTYSYLCRRAAVMP
eukprot:21321-Amphidinium_carterae.1